MSFSFRDLFNGRQQEDDDSSSELSFLETRSEESNDFFVESSDEAKIVSPFELVEESETPKTSIHNQEIFGVAPKNQTGDGLSFTNENLNESIESGFLIDDPDDHKSETPHQIDKEKEIQSSDEWFSPQRILSKRAKVTPLEDLPPIPASRPSARSDFNSYKNGQELVLNNLPKAKRLLELVNDIEGIQESIFLLNNGESLIASNVDANQSYFTSDLVNRIKSMSLLMKKNRDQLNNINCLNSSLSFIHFSSAELVLLTSLEINVSKIKPKIMSLFDEIASETLFF